MTSLLPLAARRQRALSFRAVTGDRSAVTLAVMMAAQGRKVTLAVEQASWYEALCDGQLPFVTPTLSPLLHEALRSERLDLVILERHAGA